MKPKPIKYLAIYSFFILVLIIFNPIGSTEAIDSNPVVDISTTPTGKVFDVDKMVPGDWATRTITVKNDGNQDFDYWMNSEFESGSQMFYDVLLLKVSNEDETLFDGKLKDFNGLDKRFIKQNSQEELILTVEFPYESGNEYQGLATTVLFEFTAEGKGASEPADEENPENPGEKDDQESPSTPGTPTNGGDSGTPQTGTAIPAFSGGLPQTGESMPTIYYLIGGLLIALGFALYASAQLKRRRE